MSTLLELLGLAALTAAGVLVYLPLGLLVAGGCLLYVAWGIDGVRPQWAWPRLLSRRGDR